MMGGSLIHTVIHEPRHFQSWDSTLILALKVLSLKPADEKERQRKGDEHTWQLLWAIPKMAPITPVHIQLARTLLHGLP